MKRTAPLIGAAFAILLAGCGQNSDQTESADGQTSALTVYSGRNEELIGPILDRFTKETGIEVKLRAGDSGELGAQILTESSSTPADVFISQDAGALGAVEKAGLLQKLPDNLVDRVDEAFRAPSGNWVGLSGRARVIIYNPEKIPNPPKTVDELIDPKYKGTIGFAPTNASFQSFVTGLRVLRGDDATLTWLEAFAANEPKAFEKNGAVRDAVEAGEIDLGLVNHYYLLELIGKDGAENVTTKNQFAAPGDPAGLVNVAGIGVLTSTDSKSQAEQLVEYLLSKPAQEYFANETFEYPLSAGVTANEALPSLDELKPPAINLSDLDSLPETQELLAQAGLLTQ